MTAGSIILVDVSKGVDGLEPLTRLTPETPFPESEELLQAVWRSAVATEPPVRYPDMDRWPGQCYRSPYPLSEKFFLAAYSFDTLIGEPKGNPANMFGLYWVDAFGNKELIYRDLNQASAWPSPLTARPKPPVLPPSSIQTAYETGTYFVKNVQDSDPLLPPNSVKSLRVVQVLPKSTSGANNPPVGLPNASPGRQVLGTVPVESDGSAYFRAPAGIPLAFQALDETGQAVQIMRSVTYLQSGEQASCIGCHENRLSAPEATRPSALAAKRPPSEITPGPDGSNPMSYPILVQPVLDKHCVKCHSGDKPAGPEGKPVVLTGAAEGKYTFSYNALVARVSFSSWGRGAFPDGNCEPLCKPGFFGAKGSPLTKMLMDGHNDVKLEQEEWDRLITWMDSNALFYGTFDFADQDRQQRGERIAGPALQ
jgi:mono/diheme cytochrome c family protein